jgi:MFS family permease
MAQMGVMQHQVPLIIEGGISASSAAAALGLTAGIGGLGKLTFGRISESLPFHWVTTLCFGLQALGVVILLNAHSLAMIWVYVVVFGFSMGGVIVLQPLAVGQFFGLNSFGVILGLIALVQALGGAIGAYGSGLIYDHFGSYRLALLIYIAVYLTATAAIFLAGRPALFDRDRSTGMV